MYVDADGGLLSMATGVEDADGVDGDRMGGEVEMTRSRQETEMQRVLLLSLGRGEGELVDIAEIFDVRHEGALDRGGELGSLAAVGGVVRVDTSRSELVSLALLLGESFVALEGADGVAQGFFFDEGDQIHSFPRIDLVVHINGEGGWVELDDGRLGVQDERTIGGGE